MAYNPPANMTSSVDLFTWINGTTNQFFFPGLIIAVFIIMLVKLMAKTEDVGKAFASASFTCMILSILLRVTNLINNTFMVIFIILTAVSAVWMHLENSKYG